MQRQKSEKTSPEATESREKAGQISRRDAVRQLGVGAGAVLLTLTFDEGVRLVRQQFPSVAPSGVAEAATGDYKDVDFGIGLQYDSGVQTAVALNVNGVALEVHKSQGNSGLYYHVGTINRADVQWGPSYQYDSGANPRCALNRYGVAVEVHKSQSNSGLWYHVGSVNGQTINWSGSVNYDSGATPSVALNDVGKVVEVHKSQSNSGLWYHVGQVNGSSINWGGSVNYDSGATPSIAINNSGLVVEVHSDGGSSLYYHVGQVSGNSIAFGPSYRYDSGINPTVALTDDGYVIETHQSQSAGTLWSWVGYVSGNQIVWLNGPIKFDDGVTPSVATNGKVAIQTHQSQGGTTLWSTTSLLTDHGSWIQKNLSVIGTKTLKNLALPASHDSGMYLSSFPASLGQTQDLNLYDQLRQGVRYFDLRPRWDGTTLTIQHTVNGPAVQEVLNDVKRFLDEGRRELVILKFSHYDSFDSNGAAYGQLVQRIQQTLGAYLYSLPQGQRLADITMNQFLQTRGQVLIVNDGDYPLTYPSGGIYVYRDWSSGDPQNGDLRVYDQYANTTSYDTMKQDQFSKFAGYNGYCQNNSSVPCDLFLLSWTLTPITDVYNVSKPANAALGQAINQLTNPNTYGKIVNLVYVDYIEYARATDVCLYLNGIA